MKKLFLLLLYRYYIPTYYICISILYVTTPHFRKIYMATISNVLISFYTEILSI